MTELQEVESASLLAIYDLSLDGQHDAKSVREAKDLGDLAGALKDLPGQGECCRLYIAGNLVRQGRDTLEDHLRTIVPLYNNSSSKGANSLIAQWANTKPSMYHALDLITERVDDGGSHSLDRGTLRRERMRVTCSIGCHKTVESALLSK
jgi:hypothetical protein